MTSWPELDPFRDALDCCDPHQATGCANWTSHYLLAHVVAGAAAMRDAAIAAVEHREPPAPTFGDERELPYRRCSFDALRAVFVAAVEELAAALNQLVSGSPETPIWFAGLPLSVDYIVKHARTELAVHRWDLVGDDDVGMKQLADLDLLRHSVENLGQLLMIKGMSQDRPEQLLVRLRATAQPDVEIQVGPAGQTMRLVDRDETTHAIVTDPAARLLLIWGRQPQPPSRIVSDAGSDLYAQTRHLLAGF